VPARTRISESDQHEKALSFGALQLSIENRLLTNRAKVVPLGARATDILIILVEHEVCRSDCRVKVS
jgi:DNA-binding winged helix-turn-helix (wHTH) protein